MDGKLIAKIIYGIWVLFALFQVYDLVNSFKQLPSPLFGGDYYYQMGTINHYMRGGALLESTSLQGEIFSYSPLYGWLVSLYGKLLGLSPFEAMKQFSILTYLLSSIIWYFALKEILGDEIKAVLGSILVNAIIYHPVFKYTDFTYVALVPVFFWALKKAWENEIYGFLLGLILGLLGYSHGVVFVGASIITFVALVMKKSPKLFLYVGLGALILFPLIFSYLRYWPFEKKFPRYKMDFPDLSNFSNQIWFFQFFFDKLWFGFYGILLIPLLWKRNKMEPFYKAILIGALIATFSFIVLDPLLGINLFPTYMSQLIFFPAFVITILGLTKLDWKLLLLIIIGAMVWQYMDWGKKLQGQFIEVGKQPLPPEWQALQEYLNKHSTINDVVLTSKELGFAVNALTGIKLITGRWAQNTNNPYIDMPLRDVESSIILYGTNDAKRRELLKKYNVTYVLFSPIWPSLEFTKAIIPRNKYEAATSLYDPLFSTNLNYAQLLDINHVKYFKVNMWLDPSVRIPQVKTFNTIVVSWENYVPRQNAIWNPSLDKYLEEVWSYKDGQGRKIMVLYKVKNI